MGTNCDHNILDFYFWSILLPISYVQILFSETRWGEILNLSNTSGRTRPWGFTQALTQMSTKNIKKMFVGSKVRSVRGADNLTAIYEPIV
jgi:hypothetical protein